MERIEANKQRKDLYQAQQFIAKNLRLLRNIKGISQENVADMLHMSRSCYCNLESGSKMPDLMTICQLSKFYNVSLDYLLAFDISEHMLSLLKIDRNETEALHFIERYLQLSYGGKEQIRKRVEGLLEQEKEFNKFPWDYHD